MLTQSITVQQVHIVKVHRTDLCLISLYCSVITQDITYMEHSGIRIGVLF